MNTSEFFEPVHDIAVWNREWHSELRQCMRQPRRRVVTAQRGVWSVPPAASDGFRFVHRAHALYGNALPCTVSAEQLAHSTPVVLYGSAKVRSSADVLAVHGFEATVAEFAAHEDMVMRFLRGDDGDGPRTSAEPDGTDGTEGTEGTDDTDDEDDEDDVHTPLQRRLLAFAEKLRTFVGGDEDVTPSFSSLYAGVSVAYGNLARNPAQPFEEYVPCGVLAGRDGILFVVRNDDILQHSRVASV